MTMGTPPLSSSPIADLSYRNYDGPLNPRVIRWWIVALSTLRQLRKKPWLWVIAALATMPYLFMIAILYFTSSNANMTNNVLSAPTGQKFASLFLMLFSWQGLLLFIIALSAGAGSIALDNQANALLVYLAKPITKGDYLLGKWMGIFLVVFAVAFTPALFLYAYCLLSYSSQGFLRDEPLLIFRILLVCAIPGAIHASLVVGFSAWSKTPRMASAIYSGFYFISGILVPILAITLGGGLHHGVLLTPTQNLIQHLSISGVIQGLVQNVYGVENLITNPQSPGKPALLPLLGVAIALVVLGVGAARAKIKAVEVIRG